MNMLSGGQGLQGLQYFNMANAMQNAGMQGGNRAGMADFSGASGAQQALLQNINNGFAAVNAAQVRPPRSVLAGPSGRAS
jgi:hypothetical protein